MLAETHYSTKSYRLILALGVCISLFLSWLSIRNNYVLSPDSLLYIFTSTTYIENGLSAAVGVYRWPALSIIIAKIHNITGLSLLNSGYFLIASFYAGITCVFISLIRDMGGETRSLLIALVVISFFPTLNDYRDYITRDAGFWLFTLLSLQQLIRFSKKNNLKHALGWFLFTLAAIIFRTEALFFAAFAPLALLFDSHLDTKSKLQKAAALYSLLASAGILALIFMSAIPALSGKLRLFSEISNLGSFATDLTDNFKDSIRVISEAKPYIHFVEDINAIFILGLSGLVLYTILHTLTLPYVIVLCWPLKNDKAPRNQTTYAITYLVLIISYLMIKTFHGFFTTDRYCLTAALLIMLTIPFKINTIWKNISYSQQKLPWQKTLLLLLLLYPPLDSLINSNSDKQYIAEATEWVSKHKAADQKLLTNHKQIAVLGANCLSSCFVDNNYHGIEWGNLNQYSQLVIRIKHKETMLQDAIANLQNSGEWHVIRTFTNVKNDKVVILSRLTRRNSATQ